jgi:insertion element IS1 protein InsB
LAYVFGRRQDEVLLRLKALLEPFGIRRFHPHDWGTYTRHPGPEVHHPGDRDTQQSERKHLPLRTRIKRLARKTIGFSQSAEMHDIVIGLFVTHDEFGRPLWHRETPDLKHDHLLVVQHYAGVAIVTPEPT